MSQLATSQPSRQFITVDHYQFSYRAVGDASHPPILFLHGFMGDCDEFASAILQLASQFYCIAVDLPGHGYTKTRGSDRSYGMQETAAGLIQFLECLNLPPCFLVGYSMGGRLALYLTLTAPNYFRKTVLESASPGLKTQMERDQRLQHDLNLAQRLQTEPFSAFITHWYNQPLFATLHTHPNFQAIVARRLHNQPWELSKSLCHLGTGAQPSLWPDLQHNTVPLLLLVGELDQKFVAINTEMAQCCQTTTLEILKGCGHNTHMEKSDLFYQNLKHFFQTPC